MKFTIEPAHQEQIDFALSEYDRLIRGKLSALAFTHRTRPAPRILKKAKIAVLEQVLPQYAYLEKCVTYNPGPLGAPTTYEEAVSFRFLLSLGPILQLLYQDLGWPPTKKTRPPPLPIITPEPISDIGPLNGSASARYRKLCQWAADNNSLIPPDCVVAILLGCASATAVRSTMGTVDNWIFVGTDYPGTSAKAWKATAPRSEIEQKIEELYQEILKLKQKAETTP